MHVGRVCVAVASVPPMAGKLAVSCWLPTVLGPVFAVAVLTALQHLSFGGVVCWLIFVMVLQGVSYLLALQCLVDVQTLNGSAQVTVVNLPVAECYRKPCYGQHAI